MPGRARSGAPAAPKVKPKAVRPNPLPGTRNGKTSPDTVHLPPLPHFKVTEAPLPQCFLPRSAVPDSSTAPTPLPQGSYNSPYTYSPASAPDLSARAPWSPGRRGVDVNHRSERKGSPIWPIFISLGYGIESSVIGTLKTWTFHPHQDGNPLQCEGIALSLLGRQVPRK